MTIRRRCTWATLVFLASGTVAARAQTLSVGAGAHVGVERFAGDPTLNRLDGSAPGWTVFAAAAFGPLQARVEGWRQAGVENREALDLVTGTRAVTVRSSLTHRTYALAALGGFVHDISSRAQLTTLAGLARTTVVRTFTTNAAQLIPIGPAGRPSAPTITRLVDRSVAWTVGGDVAIRASSRARVLLGIRYQPVDLSVDISGRSVRLLAGVSWRVG